MPEIDLINDPFFTVTECARLLRVSKMTVYRLIHEGELPACQVGSTFRVFESELHRYLARSPYTPKPKEEEGIK